MHIICHCWTIKGFQNICICKSLIFNWIKKYQLGRTSGVYKDLWCIYALWADLVAWCLGHQLRLLSVYGPVILHWWCESQRALILIVATKISIHLNVIKNNGISSQSYHTLFQLVSGHLMGQSQYKPLCFKLLQVWIPPLLVSEENHKFKNDQFL